jgi:Ca-activated chloride channel family protein
MMTRFGLRVPAWPGAVQASVSLTLAAGLVLGGARALDARQAVERRVYVSVLDEKDVPVPGLTPADFVVREDGVAREVLRASRATDPMQIAVLVDDTQVATRAISDERKGLEDFVKALHQGNDIALMTFGDRPEVLVDYTPSLPILMQGIGRLFARPNSGSYLLQALMDVTKGLQARKATRPVIVALVIEGQEFSNDHYQAVIEALQESGAQFHALIRPVNAVAEAMTDEIRNRTFVLSDGTLTTGGRRQYLLANSAFPAALASLAEELKDQYLLVYARPQSLIPPERIEISVGRPGLTVRAPTRTGGR